MTLEPHDNPDPAEALAAIRQTRQDMHRKVGAGSWSYDLTYSAICAAMVGAQALDEPMNLLAVGAGSLWLAILFRRHSDRLGVSVTGMSPRRARWVAIGIGMIFLPLIVAGILLNHFAPSGALLASGIVGLSAVAFIVALVGSRLWLKVYREETGQGE